MSQSKTRRETVRKARPDIAVPLLAWYTRNKRDLPWRKTRDPYRIWVSEAMLQQTRVETVIPYYNRFLSEFPNIRTLAQAPLEHVLKVWENLGYYSRARNLHAAAGIILQRMEGEIPKDGDSLLALPGVGPYIAAAIRSLAFGERVPALDGNVRRVLCRILAIRIPLDRPVAQKRISRLAEQALQSIDSSSFNQGLMDLGAQVCTPRNPSCTQCPLEHLCLARGKGIETTVPVKRKRRPLPLRDAVAAVLHDRRNRLLVVRRPGSGLLGGLWKFPGGVTEAGEGIEEALERTVMKELGIRVRVGRPLASVKHAYSHFRIRLHAFACEKTGGRPRPLGCEAWRWVEPDRVEELPLSRAERKLIEALERL
ncbi:MAG: A/G-specific adenine glycosylase [Deltaproteobacteria bacterium]|nr:A/G-specific adenine glycosylase [Deltaproteobacteria bacterium]